MNRMDPDRYLETVVLVLASVGLAGWSLCGVIKDEIASVQRNKRRHRR